jgi:hypothetical protein
MANTVFDVISPISDDHKKRIYNKWAKLKGKTFDESKIHQSFYYVAKKPAEKLSIEELSQLSEAIGVAPEVLLSDCRNSYLYRTKADGNIERLGVLGGLGESEYHARSKRKNTTQA